MIFPSPKNTPWVSSHNQLTLTAASLIKNRKARLAIRKSNQVRASRASMLLLELGSAFPSSFERDSLYYFRISPFKRRSDLYPKTSSSIAARARDLDDDGAVEAALRVDSVKAGVRLRNHPTTGAAPKHAVEVGDFRPGLTRPTAVGADDQDCPVVIVYVRSDEHHLSRHFSREPRNFSKVVPKLPPSIAARAALAVFRFQVGNSFHSRPSSRRPALFFPTRPIFQAGETGPHSPHCLKKKGTRAATH